MWRVMGLIFYNDANHFVDALNHTYYKDEIIDFLNNTGIGIFDTASAVRRLQDNASDKYLEVVVPSDIDALLDKMPQCRSLVTTGQKATEVICNRYGISLPKIGSYSEFERLQQSFRMYRMPSTSRAYPLSLIKKAELYRSMFLDLGILNP